MEQVALDLQAEGAAARFALGGRIVSVAPLGEGHIHATYVVTARSGAGPCRYVLQRINRQVFRNPEAVTRNVERVVRHLRQRTLAEGGDPRREVLTLVSTTDGSSLFRGSDGNVWRCCRMIEGARAHSTVVRPREAYAVAGAFGRFLRRLSGFSPASLEVTVPGFHDTSGDLRVLRQVAQRDPCHRLAEATQEVAFIERRSGSVETWQRLVSSGRLPARTVHGDTKVNNVLIDEDTGRGICVIDLDTVMSGTAATDIGDCARSALTGPEASGGSIDVRLFEAVVRGFLDEVRDLLDVAEIEAIVPATRIIALELAARFLGDFLVGDRWFPIGSPSDNLARCRVQLGLVRWIEGRDGELREIVGRVADASRAAQRSSTATEAVQSRIDGGNAQT